MAFLTPFLRGAVGAVALAAGLAASAQAGDLPPPYVSRALDAVLIPVTAGVKTAFALAADETGVLVLAVQPGGVADTAGVVPGDIINLVHGKQVLEPVTLDEIVYFFLQKGDSDYALAGGGKTYAATITTESWSEVIDVTTVSSWSSTTSESFSYEEYTSEYSSEISESYASSEQVIEAEASSEEFAADEGGDGDGTDPNIDSDADGLPDISDADAKGDGTADAADSAADDAGSNGGDSGGDSGGSDSGGGDSGGDAEGG